MSLSDKLHELSERRECLRNINYKNNQEINDIWNEMNKLIRDHLINDLKVFEKSWRVSLLEQYDESDQIPYYLTMQDKDLEDKIIQLIDYDKSNSFHFENVDMVVNVSCSGGVKLFFSDLEKMSGFIKKHKLNVACETIDAKIKDLEALKAILHA